MDDFVVWGVAAAAAAVLIPLVCYFAPARTKILVDTPTSTARAEMRLLWGMGPAIIARALPKKANGSPLAIFNDAARIGYALMTPGIANAAGMAVRRLHKLKPRALRLEFKINLGSASHNLVVQTAAQAALAVAPAPLRDLVVIGKSEAPGAELSADFELDASPAQLGAIYGRFKGSRAAQEFRKRLARKPKRSKKGAREVRVS